MTTKQITYLPFQRDITFESCPSIPVNTERTSYQDPILGLFVPELSIWNYLIQ